MGLVSEQRSKWSARGRESPVIPVDVFAICDGRLNGLLGVAWYARLHARPVLPCRIPASIPECATTLRELVVHVRPYRLLHIAIVWRAISLENRLAVSLQPHGGRHRHVP